MNNVFIPTCIYTYTHADVTYTGSYVYIQAHRYSEHSTQVYLN